MRAQLGKKVQRERQQRSMVKTVELKNIWKRFDMGSTQVEALKGINLDINDGEFMAIMGPSGSGKSTLLYILGCLDKPSSGSYKLLSKRIPNLSDIELSLIRATKIGFIFQTFNLVHQLNVIENVELPFIYNHIEDGKARNRAMEAIKKVGLEPRLSHRPSELSAGEMQRVAIARAIVIDPTVILADEPTGNLDSATGKDILHIFEQLHSEGATIVMVTHDSAVAHRAQRIIHLRDGNLNGKN